MNEPPWKCCVFFFTSHPLLRKTVNRATEKGGMMNPSLRSFWVPDTFVHCGVPKSTRSWSNSGLQWEHTVSEFLSPPWAGPSATGGDAQILLVFTQPQVPHRGRGKNQSHLKKGEKRERRNKEREVGEGRMQGRLAYKWRENRKSLEHRIGKGVNKEWHETSAAVGNELSVLICPLIVGIDRV